MKNLLIIVLLSIISFLGCSDYSGDNIDTIQFVKIKEVEKNEEKSSEIIFYIDSSIKHPELIKEGIQWVANQYQGCFTVSFSNDVEGSILITSSDFDENDSVGGAWLTDSVGNAWLAIDEENIGNNINLYKYIVAHEFIHMLTGTGLHEDTGVMKPYVNRNDSLENSFIGPLSQRDITRIWCQDLEGFHGLE